MKTIILPTADRLGYVLPTYRDDDMVTVHEYVTDTLVAVVDCRPGRPVRQVRFDDPTAPLPRPSRIRPTHVEYSGRMVRADGWVEAVWHDRSQDVDAVTGWHIHGLTDTVEDPRVYPNRAAAVEALQAWGEASVR